MSILAWIEEQRKLKILNASKAGQTTGVDGSKGLWVRCDNCGVILYLKHLKENQYVCFGCHFHLQMTSFERIRSLIDPGTWRPLDTTLSPCDPLEFQDQQPYIDRLSKAQKMTQLQDAVQTGTGLVDGIPVALGVMDFEFMGGSMGSVVGEKITRLIEYATQEGLTLIIMTASGGARMQEGIFSLMQMSKISAALHVHQSCANLLYIALLTSPTTGGVTASFAMLGDLIFAEPKALIGFAGRRVIEQTLQEELPDDFQTSEYLLHHGLVDLIVPRRFLKQALVETMTFYKDAPYKRQGAIPFGIQPPLSCVQEEHVRRQFKKVSTTETWPLPDLFNDPNAWSTHTLSTDLAHACDIYAKDKSADFLYREVLTSFETMLNLVTSRSDSQSAKRSANSDTPTIAGVDPLHNPTNDTFFEDALQVARSESIQWRTVYETPSETTHIPFLDFFTQTPAMHGPGHASLLYRIVTGDRTAHTN